MTILNLHDRRAIEALVERMDTEAITRCLDEGGLSAFARDVVADELARRVLGGEACPGLRASPAPWLVADRLVPYAWVAWCVVWLLLVGGRLL